jgi:hypothetical protein
MPFLFRNRFFLLAVPGILSTRSHDFQKNTFFPFLDTFRTGYLVTGEYPKAWAYPKDAERGGEMRIKKQYREIGPWNREPIEKNHIGEGKGK